MKDEKKNLELAAARRSCSAGAWHLIYQQIVYISEANLIWSSLVLLFHAS